MDLMEKLAILGDSAKYDVSCSSSGSTGRKAHSAALPHRASATHGPVTAAASHC